MIILSKFFKFDFGRVKRKKRIKLMASRKQGDKHSVYSAENPAYTYVVDALKLICKIDPDFDFRRSYKRQAELLELALVFAARANINQKMQGLRNENIYKLSKG